MRDSTLSSLLEEMQSRSAILTILAAVAAAALAAQKPNLIFLILDDQDSQLGSGLDVMPNYVSRFVEGGATATNAFVATPKVLLLRN